MSRGFLVGMAIAVVVACGVWVGGYFGEDGLDGPCTSELSAGGGGSFRLEREHTLFPPGTHCRGYRNGVYVGEMTAPSTGTQVTAWAILLSPLALYFTLRAFGRERFGRRKDPGA